MSDLKKDSEKEYDAILGEINKARDGEDTKNIENELDKELAKDISEDSEETENSCECECHEHKHKLALNIPKFDPKSKSSWAGLITIIIIIALVIAAICIKASDTGKPVEPDVSPQISVDKEDKGNKNNKQEVVLPDTQEYVDTLENKPKTEEQRRALDDAIQLYKYQSLSHDAIVNLLVSEGKSEEDAKYAADNCGADWNQVATFSATAYNNYEPYSKQRLIAMLVADSFTPEQASYGVENAGIDFVESAKRCANDYLSVENYDKAKLVELLVNNEGYTQQEADMGAEQALAD